MTTTKPEEIRDDIERTRRELSDDVNALQEKVSPSRVVGRRVERTKSAFTSAKDRVMGSAGSATGSAGDRMSSVTSSVADTASEAPQIARQQTQGNPLAAGLIAFGAGWLVASVMPATDKEQELAGQVKDKASEQAGPVKEQLGQVAGEMKDNLREPAQHAAESVKGKASDAAGTVKEDARSAKDDAQRRT